MDGPVFVYVDLEGKPILVGHLWMRARKGKESATFEYSEAWLAFDGRFSLEPALMLGAGPQHTPPDRSIFGAIGDSAPDRWGRALMRRMERRRAKKEKRVPRTLMEIDYLLMVNDEARQGALRFSLEEGGEFLAPPDGQKIPPLLELPRLLSATERYIDEDDSDEDLRLLIAPGSSLGGARPKASVRDENGHLMIAKFPHKEDEINITAWEAVALTLADRAGIPVPRWRIETVAGRQVLLLYRFDRTTERWRIPFLSAMSMLGAKDREIRSYLEIADALRQHGASPTDDMRQLWRRILFNILISNTDDHLRNHGFLYAGGAGWRLSPAYDLNPVPVDIKPRELSVAIDTDYTQATLGLVLSVAEYFMVGADEAVAIAYEVAKVVSDWRYVAASLGIKAAEIDRMASAFEHEDLQMALSPRN